MAPQQSPASLVSTIDPPSFGPPHPMYSGVTTVPISDTSTLITVAGQVATKPDGIVPDTLEEQIELCLSRLETCLHAAGAGIADMTRFMYYFTEKAYADDANVLNLVSEKATPWLRGHRPASCFLVVKGLSEAKFMCEFEAQAVIRAQK